MFKLLPFTSEKIWGYERWVVSTLHEGLSSVEGEDITLDKKLQADYPLLIKLIQANSVLSVQVHPEDEYAKRVENSYGKTECWYILDAQKDASLICGLKGTFGRDDLAKAIAENTLENYLYSVPIETGDFIFIPAGTVHAIKGGLRILEVQQPSDITYRLYDWGRGREQHVQKSLDVIENAFKQDLKPYSLPIKNFAQFSCEYFTLEKLAIAQKFTYAAKKETVFIVLKGTGSLTDGQKTYSIKEEDTFMVLPGEQAFFSGELTIMKIIES